MAKNKNSKRGNLKKKAAGKRKTRPKSFPVKVAPGTNSAAMENPFELRLNKKKHDNLGKIARNEQGVPGISRSRAIEKRKATLLQEYKVRNKSNVILDKRIGEKRKGMPEEEKIIRRSAAEKARQFKKKSIFNLQDTDDLLLTHKGQPLTAVDRYEDPRDVSDSDEERLDADFVSDANFGGFMKMKKPEEEDEEMNDDGTPKSHKQIIQELILESKRKKFEKAKEADENYELVCKLDDEFKNPDVRNLLLFGGKGKKMDVEEKDEKEDYDKLVRELQFEAKAGRAADRLKTEAELEQEEKEKLEQLERERLKRMQVTDTDQRGIKHRSADDLDDGYAVDSSLFGASHSAEDEEGSDVDEEEAEEEEEDGDDESSDSYDDVGSDDEEEDANSQKDSSQQLELDGKPDVTDQEKFSDIPFVLTVPTKYKEFEAMLKKYRAHYKLKSHYSSEALELILTRMIKYNKASDRSRLPKLFNFLMRYTLDLAEKNRKFSKPLLHHCRLIIPHLHTLLVLNPSECAHEVENGEIFDDFYPMKGLPVQKMVYLKLCTELFSASDFHHRVLSPLKVKILEALVQFKVTDPRLACKTLFLIEILFRMSKESRRYTPEISIVLDSLLQCYLGSESRWAGFAVPSIRPCKAFLYVGSDVKMDNEGVKDELWRFISDQNQEDLPWGTSEKLGVLSTTLKLLKKFIPLYERLPSSIEIFRNTKKAISELQHKLSWPSAISKEIADCLEAVNNLKMEKETLHVPVSDKPKLLKLYEPLLEEDFNGIRKKKVPKGKQETARLGHKVKQEMKHAVREIKKDSAFLAKQQLKEQLEKDSERKRKVKEILGSLANQEGEYQKSQKLKKKN